MPVKPMYSQAAAFAVNQANQPGRARRQVIQQIIHNNGSGNIMFSGSNLESGAVAINEKIVK
jgi:hypothetical protein